MGHDVHFLERLDRLSRPQVEVALSLYRDHGLVRKLLNDLVIPESVERVAISLADATLGPFVVVTREGRFVTCLAEGMRVSGIPIVTKERFDAAAREVHRIREMMEEAARYPSKQVKAVLSRVLEGGSDISREDFLSVASWSPLIGFSLLYTFVTTADRNMRTYDKLARRQSFKRRDEEPLYQYWQEAWALGHLSVLLGVDGGRMIREALQKLPDTAEKLATLVSWPTVRLAVTSMAARGVWLAAKVGKPLLPTYKRDYQSVRDALLLLNAGFGLSAIAFAHKRTRAEIGKVLSPTSPPEESGFGKYVHTMQKAFSWRFDTALADWDNAGTLMESLARTVVKSDTDSGGEWAFADEERFPAEVRIAAMLRVPIALVEREAGALMLFLLQLPWIARAKAEEFYLSREYHYRETWTPEHSLALLEPRRRIDRRSRASARARATPAPGRNDPCSCGSGKKFKRCCGAA